MTGNPWIPWAPAIDGVEMTAHPVDLLKQGKVGQLCVREDLMVANRKMLNKAKLCCVVLCMAWSLVRPDRTRMADVVGEEKPMTSKS